MTTTTVHLMQSARDQFPALQREVGDQTAVFLDGPAGTQVPRCVIDAMSHYLVTHNANHGGPFVTSQESDAEIDSAHQAYAEFVNGNDPGEISFGQNMTSLTFALSRAIARTWKPGDEIIVTKLDHDANVSPWVLAARDQDVTVKMVDFHHNDCTLNVDDFRSKLNDRTRLVAFGAASNASGTINPVRDLTKLAHEVGATVFVDAVHYAPHGRVDVQDWNCDFVAFSSYKFFGPHLGVLWGRRALLESLEPYKVRPAPVELPGRWMTGTQSHESIMGAKAAVDYLANLGRDAAGAPDLHRREALVQAYKAIHGYERELCTQLLEGLASIPGLRVWGITDRARLDERCATVSITHDHTPTSQLARELGQRGIFVWSGNYYALNFTETLGLEPEGMVRIGLLHYNTAEEVERLLQSIRDIVSQNG